MNYSFTIGSASSVFVCTAVCYCFYEIEKHSWSSVPFVFLLLRKNNFSQWYFKNIRPINSLKHNYHYNNYYHNSLIIIIIWWFMSNFGELNDMFIITEVRYKCIFLSKISKILHRIWNHLSLCAGSLYKCKFFIPVWFEKIVPVPKDVRCHS